MLQMLPILFFLLLLSCTDLPMSGQDPVAGNFPMTTDFETSVPSQIHQETAKSTSMSLVASPVGISGGNPLTKSALLTVEPGDAVNHGNRSEMAVYHCGTLGDTMYFGWDMALPLSDPDDYQWQITAQWYQLPDFERGETFDYWGAHPPVTLVLVPGKIQLKTTIGGEAVLAEVPYSKGVWHRLVVGIKFLNTSEGEIQAWLDGTALSSSPVKAQTLWNRAGAYFKCGLYRGAVGQKQAPSANSCYIDNLRISRNKAEVM